MEFISSEKTRDKYDIGNIIEDFQNGVLKDGDEVDIKGAQGVGIDQVYYNPAKKELGQEDMKPTYIISSLLELKAMV